MKNEAIATIRDVTGPDFVQRAHVLQKNETRRERIWKDCVAEAKQIMVMHDELRFKIVDLANKACIIHHGGRATSERFTVKKFAAEVGVTYHTLLEWMRVKKTVYDHLNESQRKDMTLTQLRNIDRMLVGQKGSLNLSKAVQSAFKKQEEMSASTVKMKQYIKNLNALAFNVRHKMMIKDCDEEVLAQILHLSREIVRGLAYIDTKTSRSQP